jgi:hypothetical protein
MGGYMKGLQTLLLKKYVVKYRFTQKFRKSLVELTTLLVAVIYTSVSDPCSFDMDPDSGF